MTQKKAPEPNSAGEQPSAASAPSTIDLTAMLGMLLQSQAESAAVNRRLLEIELKKQEAEATKDAEAKARLEKERRQLHEQMQIKIKNDELRVQRCPHQDQRGGSTIYPISNHPDRQVRGMCTRCPIYIEPQHYEIGADGQQTLVPEHPLYRTVLQRDQALYSEFVPTTGY